MIKNYDESAKINNNPKWPNFSDHPYWICVMKFNKTSIASY